MAKMEEPLELFQEKLSEMLYVERTLADEVLPKLKQEVTDSELQRGIAEHLEQTRRHHENLERVCEMVGFDGTEKKSPALDGMKKEHDQGIKGIDRQELCDLFDAQAAATTEHYEIASYNGMITMAESMGEPEIASILRENLRQEEEALRRLETATEKLSRELVTA